jgi:hypothetical protein
MQFENKDEGSYQDEQPLQIFYKQIPFLLRPKQQNSQRVLFQGLKEF